MTKKEIIQKNEEYLQLLKKEVPKYEWKLQRFETKGRYHDINEYDNEELYDTHFWYMCEHNGGEGRIKIENELDISVEFHDSVSYKEKQSKLMTRYGESTDEERSQKMWEEIREFFETYLIPQDELIEKKLRTPRIENLLYKIYNCFTYEFNEILLEILFYDKSERRVLNKMNKDFEERYHEKLKELGLKHYNSYFVDTIDMIKSYMEERLTSDIDYYLEQKWDDIEDDLDKEVNSIGSVKLN